MKEPGFELTIDNEEPVFIPFALSTMGAKEMKIIDRCTAMPLDEFAAALDDPSQRTRGPVLLAMIALSIRAHYPDWTVERIMRLVDDMDELPTFVGGDEEDAAPDPLPQSEERKSSARASAGSSSSAATTK
jgi:hypothetical protein